MAPGTPKGDISFVSPASAIPMPLGKMALGGQSDTLEPYVADPQSAVADPRVEQAASAELAALDANERFLLAAYFLHRRTLAEIAKLQGVHESTISRKLERITSTVRKSVRKRLLQAGMTPRQADEAMEDIDVRDLRVKVSETLQQGSSESTFYPKKGESQG